MSPKPRRFTEPPATLSLRIGQWFEANATGWGVVCVPVVVLLLLVAAAASRLAFGEVG